MEFWMVCAMLEGYDIKVRDGVMMAIQTGYYCGYYNNARRPKSPAYFIKKLFKKHNQPAPDVTPEQIAMFERINQANESNTKRGGTDGRRIRKRTL